MNKLIVAYDANRLIGAENRLLWRIPVDMHHFVEQTMGNACVMGRNTWESIPEKYRPLKGRFNIVLTRDPTYMVPEGVEVVFSIEEALKAAKDNPEFSSKDVFFCGGEYIYRKALELDVVDQILATEIENRFNVSGLADVRYFPELDAKVWKTTKDVRVIGAPYNLNFVTYTKI